MNIDRPKLARLQMDLEQKYAERRSLQSLYDDARADMQAALMHLGSGLSITASRHWRPGDDIAQLLNLPDDVRSSLQQEVAQAEHIQSIKSRLSALQARLAPLTGDCNALAALVRNLEAYANAVR